MNSAYYIDAINFRPRLRYPTGQHYFENLAVYTKGLDLTNISTKTVVLGSLTLYYTERHHLILY